MLRISSSFLRKTSSVYSPSFSHLSRAFSATPAEPLISFHMETEQIGHFNMQNFAHYNSFSKDMLTELNEKVFLLKQVEILSGIERENKKRKILNEELNENKPLLPFEISEQEYNELFSTFKQLNNSLNLTKITPEEYKSMKNLQIVILKSKLKKIFCAGANLKERLSMKNKDIAPFVAYLRGSLNQFATLSFIKIGGIDGIALGGGFEFLLTCDLRVGGEKTMLGLPEVNLGILPGAGGTQRLSRVVGIDKAKEMILLSKKITGEECYKLGLVNEYVKIPEELKDTEASFFLAGERAHQLAVEMLSTSGPFALRMAAKAVEEGGNYPMEEALKIEKKYYEEIVFTDDRIEGLKSFIEKRKPVYTGK